MCSNNFQFGFEQFTCLAATVSAIDATPFERISNGWRSVRFGSAWFGSKRFDLLWLQREVKASNIQANWWRHIHETNGMDTDRVSGRKFSMWLNWFERLINFNLHGRITVTIKQSTTVDWFYAKQWNGIKTCVVTHSKWTPTCWKWFEYHLIGHKF